MTKSSEATGPTCVGHDHYPLVMIDEVYNFSVDEVFEFVFDDGSVQQRLSLRRHRTEVVWNPWELEADGSKRRDVTYVVTIPRHPKPYNFTEKQVLSAESEPGRFYLVEVECSSPDVPYGDSFSVVDHCYITRIADEKCHMCVTCDINFQKKVWGPVKGVISDMATDGIKKYFRVLAELLRKDDSMETSGMLVEQPEFDAAELEYFEDRSFFSTGVVYLVFACSILCLTCVIGVLFHGLWASVDRITFVSSNEIHRRMSRVNNRSPVGTIADDLVAQLSELLSSATKLIETTTESLEELTRKESEIQNGQKEEEQQEQHQEHEQL